MKSKKLVCFNLERAPTPLQAAELKARFLLLFYIEVGQTRWAPSLGDNELWIWSTQSSFEIIDTLKEVFKHAGIAPPNNLSVIDVTGSF